jgi:hypothetical protein
MSRLAFFAMRNWPLNPSPSANPGASSEKVVRPNVAGDSGSDGHEKGLFRVGKSLALEYTESNPPHLHPPGPLPVAQADKLAPFPGDKSLIGRKGFSPLVNTYLPGPGGKFFSSFCAPLLSLSTFFSCFLLGSIACWAAPIQTSFLTAGSYIPTTHIPM